VPVVDALCKSQGLKTIEALQLNFGGILANAYRVRIPAQSQSASQPLSAGTISPLLMDVRNGPIAAAPGRFAAEAAFDALLCLAHQRENREAWMG
jgi:hypothetical protein